MTEAQKQPVVKNNVKQIGFSCPTCDVASTSLGVSSTLIGYSSPKGHDHDENCRTFHFRCTNEHQFTVRAINACPAEGCDWTEGKANCPSCGPWLQVRTRDPLSGAESK